MREAASTPKLPSPVVGEGGTETLSLDCTYVAPDGDNDAAAGPCSIVAAGGEPSLVFTVHKQG